MDDETLITYGGALKAVGEGRIAGFLVRYSDAQAPDIDGEFFTKATDFSLGFPAQVGLYYNHGLDPQVGQKRIGTAQVKSTEEGLWMEAQLDTSEKYQALIYQLAQMGRLGSSSGAAAHLVRKRVAGKSVELEAWPLAEASVTVKPADPRNMIAALKSLAELPPLAEAAAEGQAALKAAAQLSPLLGGEGKAGAQLSLDEHSEGAASALDGWRFRVIDRDELRVKSGRRHSAATLSHFRNVQRAAREVDALVSALLESDTAKEPPSEADVEAAASDQSALNGTALFADYQQAVARLQAASA